MDTRAILVIDDEAPVGRMLERSLSRHGHQVVVATEAESALALTAKMKFDLVIIDRNLAAEDGHEVLQQLLQYQPKLQAIMITAFPSSESKAQSIASGVARYIVKPFGMDEILSACQEALLSQREPADFN